ncbi:MAG TPA: cyclase family protein [Baekduia sp.]|nr:cyclase family protein [Baekduia sp.]
MTWVDLSQPLWEGSDRAGRATAPVVRSVMDLEHDPFTLMEYTFMSHMGTHLDAPCHFVPGAPTIDAISLDRVTGPGVVLDVPAEPLEGLGAEALAAGGPAPRPGEIVLLRTGWEDKAGTPAYFQHPYLLDSAARWLIEHRVKLVGMDLITPEMPEAVRGEPFTWPVHHALLENDVLVMENVCNMRSLAGRRVEVIAAPVNVKGGDGAPVRLLARGLDDVES